MIGDGMEMKIKGKGIIGMYKTKSIIGSSLLLSVKI